MTDYVLGFAMDTVGRVALIRKFRPAWQKGKLNGIGGKIEKFDSSPEAAMIREFREEAGLTINAWSSFATLRSNGHTIHCFRVWVDPDTLNGVKTQDETEHVSLYNVRSVRDYITVPNLAWLIPLAAYTHDIYEVVQIKEMRQ